MKVLHTSDWHLGRALHKHKRQAEMESFVDWFCEVVDKEHVDVVLLAGDVFDTSAPGSHAQELYYRFLGHMASSPCRHVVVVAGNHDSPAFLEAPAKLLRNLRVHIVGASQQDSVEREVFALENAAGEVLRIGAVPYLRERDVRRVSMEESLEDKEQALAQGIASHYAQVAQQAKVLEQELLPRPAPLVLMGHLFATGGQVSEGERNLYVGSLGQVGADIFCPQASYVALGHLHNPQKLGGREHVRYSGSPLALNFGEGPKSLCLLEWDSALWQGRAGDKAQTCAPSVRQIPVPCFQTLERITGSWICLEKRLDELLLQGKSVWLDIVYTGPEIMADLQDRVRDKVADSPLEVLCCRNQVLLPGLGAFQSGEDLRDLSPQEVFFRCLESHQVPQEQRADLTLCHEEILHQLLEQGLNGEAVGGEAVGVEAGSAENLKEGSLYAGT